MNIVIEEHNTAEVAICLLYTELAEACNVINILVYAASATAATPTLVYIVDKILFLDKFNGTWSKLWTFTTQLWLKVILFSNEQSRLYLTINCLIGEVMNQVQQYVKVDHLDSKNVKVLIDILEEAFRNPNCMAKMEAKLCSLE